MQYLFSKLRKRVQGLEHHIFKNCNLIKVEFIETNFDGCQFEKADEGSLVKTWFESCYFLDTNFEGFEGAPLIDSKFSKFDKSIDFQGEFFLIDLLQPVNGISEMFLGFTPKTHKIDT